MRKILDIHFMARPRILAGLGAALLLAGSTQAFAQARLCTVDFAVTNNTDFASLQFTVDYDAASDSGDFVSPSNADCVFSGAVTGDALSDTNADTLEVGLVSNTNVDGPADVVTCHFIVPLPASATPTNADFAIDVTDATVTPGITPASPEPVVAATVVGCVDSGSCSGSPMTGCKASTAAGKSSLQIKNDADDAKDKAKFKWGAGAATNVDEFGGPTTVGSTYSWCIYAGGSLVRGSDIPPVTGWAAAGTKGFNFKGDADGVSSVKLKSGAAGKASVQVQGKSKAGNFSAPTLPLTGTVVSQLQIDDGVAPVCFSATMGAASKSDAEQYKAKGL